MVRTKKSEFHYKPPVTPPTTRWVNPSVGFQAPEYVYDEVLAKASLPDLRRAIQARLLMIALLPEGVKTKKGEPACSFLTCLPVGGMCVLTCFHGFATRPSGKYVAHLISKKAPGLGRTSTHVFEFESAVARIGEHDACVVNLGSGAPLPDMTKWFVDGEYGAVLGSEMEVISAKRYYFTDQSDEWIEPCARSITASDYGPVSALCSHGDPVYESRTIHYVVKTCDGMSGSPVIGC